MHPLNLHMRPMAIQKKLQCNYFSSSISLTLDKDPARNV
jgi:hypothetical protein